MANGTRMNGDWKGAGDRIAAFPGELRRRLERATLQNCVGLKGEIQKGIQSGSPGGATFAPLHPFTIAQRLAEHSPRHQKKILASGGSDKPLMNHGDLWGSINYGLSADRLSGRVGVMRQAKSKSGGDMVNIAQILSEGRVIPVTPRMRAWLHSRGFHLSPATTHIIIPPRPFIAPVYHAYRGTMIDRYRRAITGFGA